MRRMVGVRLPAAEGILAISPVGHREGGTKRGGRFARRVAALLTAFALLLPAAEGLMPTARALVAIPAGVTHGVTTAPGVRVRAKASSTGTILFQLPQDYVTLVQATQKTDGIEWYIITAVNPEKSSESETGYISASYYRPLTPAEQAAYDANPQTYLTQSLSGSGKPTATTGGATGGSTSKPPSGGTTTAPPTLTDVRYGTINKGGTNFRTAISGKIYEQLKRNTVVQIISEAQKVNDVSWYGAYYNGRTGFIQAKYIDLMTDAESQAYYKKYPDSARGNAGSSGSSGSSGASTGAVVGYVTLTVGGVNLRDAPNGDRIASLDRGTVMPYYSITSKNGYKWYHVTAAGVGTGYVRDDTLTVTSGALTPTTTGALTSFGKVKLKVDKVNLRKTEAGTVIDSLEKGLVLDYYKAPTTKNGYTWYYVKPDDQFGYVRSDCVTIVSATTTTAPPPVTGNYGYIKMTADNVNVRKQPYDSSIDRVYKGNILALLAAPVKSGAYTWYYVKGSGGKAGYVRGDMCTPCDAAGNVTTVTPTPGGTTTVHGYVLITLSSVNFRKTIAGAVMSQLDKNTVWPMVGPATTSGSYIWYPIQVKGTNGFVRGDASRAMTTDEANDYLAGKGLPTLAPTATPAPADTNYVITIVDKVNLRKSASKDASAPYNVPIGTVMAFSRTTTVSGATWYKAVYSGSDIWVLGSCVRVMNSKEYADYIAANPPAAPTPTPVVGYVKTTTGGVNIRVQPAGNVVGSVGKGVILPFYTTPQEKRGYTWYAITHNGVSGYIRSDCVMLCDASGNKATVSTSQPEAIYTTLKLGSTGTAVTNLTTALKSKGYFTGSVTNTYTSAVVTAVKAFQKANNLTVDGIAGAKTQHALFGTVPVGSGTGNLEFDMYPVEKIDWKTGGIQGLWPRGTSFKVKDVRTGTVFWLRRWAGGNHVDAEPLTAADTARICDIYGVKKASEIADKNLWQRRPLWVTIGTRTFCASMYGVPHNYPEGDTIADNNFNGQLCVHFTNSTTHTSTSVDSYHEAAIDEAYKAAPARR